jgi:hypothetical protein
MKEKVAYNWKVTMLVVVLLFFAFRTDVSAAGLNVSVNASATETFVGERIVFSAAVEGGSTKNYMYQWYCAKSANGKGKAIKGATEEQYTRTMSKNDNGRYFYCKVKSAKKIRASNKCKMTIYYEPEVATNPTDQLTIKGEKATFSVDVTAGNPKKYTCQWYRCTDYDDIGTAILGATDSTYQFEAAITDDGSYYYCEISNGVYTIGTSKVKLSVIDAEITENPEDSTIEYGESTDFSVNVEGGGDYGYTYQWYYRVEQFDGTIAEYPISGANESVYTVTANSKNDGYYYWCSVGFGPITDAVSGKRTYYLNSSYAQLRVTGLDTGFRFSLKNCNIMLSEDTFTYDGEEKTPSVIVTQRNGNIVGSWNYGVKYRNNTKAGTAKVVIYAKEEGSYLGIITKKFKINKAEQDVLVKTTNYKKALGDKAFKIKVKAVGKGFFVCNNSNVVTVDNSGKVKIKGCGTTTITYKVNESKNYKSAEAQITVSVNPNRITSFQVVSAGEKVLNISWKNSAKTDGCELDISGRRIMLESKKSSYIIGCKTSGKVYKVKIRTYSVIDGKTYYSAWSKTKKVISK